MYPDHGFPTSTPVSSPPHPLPTMLNRCGESRQPFPVPDFHIFFMCSWIQFKYFIIFAYIFIKEIDL